MNEKKIKKYIDLFKKNYETEEKTLEYLFESLHSNNRIEDVLIKVSTLNSLYSTQIKNKELPIIAKIICSIDDLDKLLELGDVSAVDRIGKTKPGMNNAYVFASKYCSFHNPSKYLIFDACSWYAMHLISKKNDYQIKLNAYPTMDFEAYNNYCSCVDEFIDRNKLDFGYKEVDEFLWLYGKEQK